MRLIDADTYHASLHESYQKAIEWKKESELKKLTAHESMATQAAMTFMECILRLKEQPTVDAVPVRHGHWRHYEGILLCSECGMEFYDDIMEWCGDHVPKFCPDCGADMRKDGEYAEGTV